MCAIKPSTLKQIYPYRSLTWLNELAEADAEDVFRSCSRSYAWARTMTEMRPFKMLDDIFDAAERVWYALPAGEWLSAFEGCDSEQCRDTDPPGVVKEDLYEAAGLYRDKFGFTLVADIRGKSAKEMLEIYQTRLANSPRREFHLAGEEYRRMIADRLTSLLEHQPDAATH